MIEGDIVFVMDIFDVRIRWYIAQIANQGVCTGHTSHQPESVVAPEQHMLWLKTSNHKQATTSINVSFANSAHLTNMIQAIVLKNNKFKIRSNEHMVGVLERIWVR